MYHFLAFLFGGMLSVITIMYIGHLWNTATGYPGLYVLLSALVVLGGCVAFIGLSTAITESIENVTVTHTFITQYDKTGFLDGNNTEYYYDEDEIKIEKNNTYKLKLRIDNDDAGRISVSYMYI